MTYHLLYPVVLDNHYNGRIIAKRRKFVDLLIRDKESEIMFLGEKRIPKTIIEIDDEVTLKTTLHDIQVKIIKTQKDEYEGIVLKGGAYPEYQIDDKICFGYDNIFVCN
jgi:hypothetical protein